MVCFEGRSAYHSFPRIHWGWSNSAQASGFFASLRPSFIEAGLRIRSLPYLKEGKVLAKELIKDFATEIYQRTMNGIFDGSAKKLYLQLTTTNRDQLIWELMRKSGLSRNEVISRFIYGINRFCDLEGNFTKRISPINRVLEKMAPARKDTGGVMNLYFKDLKDKHYLKFMEEVRSMENGEGYIVIPQNKIFRRKKGKNQNQDQSLIKVEVEIPKEFLKEEVAQKEGFNYRFLQKEVKLKVNFVRVIKKDPGVTGGFLNNQWVNGELLFDNRTSSPFHQFP